MNSTFYSSISILGAAALMVVFSGLSVQAEPTQVAPEAVSSQASLQDNSPALTPDILESEVANPSIPDQASSDSEKTAAKPVVTEAPIPGTAITSATALQVEETNAASADAIAPESEAKESVVAQTITPGRATRSGPSYIAVGGNIGFGGRTALGRENFVITSKIGLTDRFSARPGLVVGRSPTILLPLTIDFPVRSIVDDRISVAPFVGGGIAISTRGGSEVRALAMGGVDIPLGERFTATASANAAFFRRPEIGVILGIGYNF